MGITLDRRISKPVMMVSTEGGMDIEEVAHHSPEKILKETIEPAIGLQRFRRKLRSLGNVEADFERQRQRSVLKRSASC